MILRSLLLLGVGAAIACATPVFAAGTTAAETTETTTAAAVQVAANTEKKIIKKKTKTAKKKTGKKKPAETEEAKEEKSRNLFSTLFGGGIKEKDLTALHANGFAVAMEVADVIGRSGDTPTAASVTKTLKDPAGGKGFMDSPWVCDGSVLKDYPSVCNASTRVTTVKDGQQVEVTSNWLGS